MNDLPIYEITFDESSFDSGIDMIAITKDPAIKEFAMRFSNDYSKRLFSIDKSQRLVMGPVLIPDLPIYRNDNGLEYYVVFTKEVIHKMVNKFSKEQRSIKFNIEHTDKHVEGFIKEQWIIESDTYDKSKMYGMNLPIGTYMISAKIENDNDWNLIKDMDRVGFSIEGYLGTTEYKLKKETNMKNKRKFFKLEEDQVIIVEEGLPIGSTVETLDENLEVIPMPDGTYEIDTTTSIVVVDGKIAEVIVTEAEEVAEEAAETYEVADEAVQADQLQLISDRLDNIVELIASIQLRLDALEATEDVAETITETEFSLSDTLFALSKTKK